MNTLSLHGHLNQSKTSNAGVIGIMHQSAHRSIPRFPLLLLLLLFLASASSGCGVVGNSVTKVLARQGEPGILYSGDFYKTARPEDVRQAIGSRSLASESFTRRSFVEGSGHSPGAVFDVSPIVDIFWPLGYIHRDEPVYPIGVAVWNTPYPEVITLMFQAGATMDQVRLSRYLNCWQDNEHNRKILRVLLDNGSTEDRILALESMVGADNRAMVEFLLPLYPDMQAGCLEGNRIIGKAIGAGRNDMAAYLRERGLYTAPSPREGMILLARALSSGNDAGYNLLVSWGCDYTCVVDGKNRLFAIAVERRKPVEPALLAQLAKVAEGDAKERDEMLSRASFLPDGKPLAIFIERGIVPPKGDKRWLPLLKKALEENRMDLFQLFISRGADCSVGDVSLLIAARNGNVQDAKVLNHLAATVSVQGEAGERALLYACEIGRADVLATLLERSPKPDKEKLATLLAVALRRNNPEIFWLLVRSGADSSTEIVNFDLLRCAHQSRVTDERILNHLAATIPVRGERGYEALRTACWMKRPDLVNKLLARGAKAEKDEQLCEILGATLTVNRPDLFWFFIDRGADLSRMDAVLMRYAKSGKVEDERVWSYLASTLPVQGKPGNDTLEYACYSGRLDVIGKVLERGARFSRDTVMLLDGDRKAIRALLSKYGQEKRVAE